MHSSSHITHHTRVDFDVIAALVAPKTQVLDVGCGDGSLLELLIDRKQIDGRGVELSQGGVDLCMARGLSVIQGDADSDLIYYPDQAFDYVILSQTLQATRDPKNVLDNLLRIGKHIIVSIPNFGYWRVRTSLLFRGRMPITKELPYSWYDTPNIHFCTIDDFLDTVQELHGIIEETVVLTRSGERVNFRLPQVALNMFGQQAVFLVRR